MTSMRRDKLNVAVHLSPLLVLRSLWAYAPHKKNKIVRTRYDIDIERRNYDVRLWTRHILV